MGNKKGMLENTNISNVIDGNADKSKYDAEVKKVLSDPQILAWILKYTVKEFKDFSIEQIIDCIDGKPEVGARYVRPGHYTKAIDGINTEDSVPGEGKVVYDIRFRVILPGDIRLGMIINVEAQKDSNPGYDIVTRGIYYCARMLSSQMGNDISAREYDKLQKVYSIWICLNVPQKAEHSITRYRIQKEEVHGHSDIDSRYDLLELVMVYLGREESAENGTKLHKLLSTVLSDCLKPEEKKEILKQEYDIITSVELEGGLVRMCNLSEAIAERNLEQGIEQGIEQGKLIMLATLVKDGTISIRVAANQAKMSETEFKRMMKV